MNGDRPSEMENCWTWFRAMFSGRALPLVQSMHPRIALGALCRSLSFALCSTFSFTVRSVAWRPHHECASITVQFYQWNAPSFGHLTWHFSSICHTEPDYTRQRRYTCTIKMRLIFAATAIHFLYICICELLHWIESNCAWKGMRVLPLYVHRAVQRWPIYVICVTFFP